MGKMFWSICLLMSRKAAEVKGLILAKTSQLVALSLEERQLLKTLQPFF